jgi:hypothetical protein
MGSKKAILNVTLLNNTLCLNVMFISYHYTAYLRARTNKSSLITLYSKWEMTCDKTFYVFRFCDLWTRCVSSLLEE